MTTQSQINAVAENLHKDWNAEEGCLDWYAIEDAIYKAFVEGVKSQKSIIDSVINQARQIPINEREKQIVEMIIEKLRPLLDADTPSQHNQSKLSSSKSHQGER